ncbi:MAG: hypothetical protein QFX35_04370 [Candidatus Verstraetearchaeota archaeon]|nr:hypothetical protein [Candidatus Verstraetearchaeota archaeon]
MGISLKAKLLLIFLAISLAPMSVAVAYTSMMDTEHTRSQLLTTLNSIAEQVASNYFDYMEKNGGAVCNAAEDLSLASSSEWGDYLDHLSVEGAILFGVADDTGRVVAVSDAERWSGTWTAPGAYAPREFISQLRAGEEFRFSETDSRKAYYTLPFEDITSKKDPPLVMIFGKSFTGLDGRRYHLYMVWDWYTVAQSRILVLQGSLFGDLGSIVITPEEGGLRLWADTNAERTGTLLSPSALGESWDFYQALSGKRAQTIAEISPEVKEYSLQGQGRIVAACMAPSWFHYSLGFIAYMTNPDAIYRFLDSARNNAIMIAGLAAAAGVGASYFFTRSISSKINRVIADAMRVASGDLREGGTGNLRSTVQTGNKGE